MLILVANYHFLYIFLFQKYRFSYFSQKLWGKLPDYYVSKWKINNNSIILELNNLVYICTRKLHKLNSKYYPFSITFYIPYIQIRNKEYRKGKPLQFQGIQSSFQYVVFLRSYGNIVWLYQNTFLFVCIKKVELNSKKKKETWKRILWNGCITMIWRH